MEVQWDVALTKDGTRVWIHDDCDEPLFCPECSGVMIPVRGEQRQHHFRHSVESDCSGESARHWTKKYEIADALQGLGSVKVEKKSGQFVPDVLFLDEWFFEVVFSNAPSHEKFEVHREKMIVFDFNERTVWDEEDFSPCYALFDETSFAEIVMKIGNDIVSGSEVGVCSNCRQVKGFNSQLFPGERCHECFFGQEKKEREIEEGAATYRRFKMR